MKYFYDRKSDSLYLTLAERPYADSVEAAPGVVLDFDDDGRLIGLDLERASRTVDVSDLEMHEQPLGHDADAAHADGTNLKREREALGLSQAELGRKLSVSSNTIARWERGELRIEHPEMLQLALATLRRNSQQVDRVAIPARAGDTFRSTGERRIARNSATGEFTSVKTNKSRNASDTGRVKKK
jgi:DNA-binding transcriptional regulator YiaG